MPSGFRLSASRQVDVTVITILELERFQTASDLGPVFPQQINLPLI